LALWATGTIVLSISFLKDFVAGSAISGFWRVELAFAWILLIISVVLGHLGFGAPLTNVGKQGWRLAVNKQTRFFSILQLAFFGFGLLGIVFFAVCHLPHNVPVAAPSHGGGLLL